MIAYYINRDGKLTEFENSGGYKWFDMIELQDTPLAAWECYSKMKLAELSMERENIERAKSRIEDLKAELARVSEKLVEALN